MKNIQAHTLKRSLCLFLSVLLVLLLIPVTAFAESTGIQPRVTSPMTGYSTASQTVYCGPSTTIYASTGSIGNGEKVYVLGTERGYYHILYSVSGGQKMGYVPQSMIRNVTGGTPEEDDFNGGYAKLTSPIGVWSCNDPSTAVQIDHFDGYNRSITVLADFVRDGTRITFIEYSSSAGTKRGFLFNASFTMPIPTCVARVLNSCNLSYGYNSRFNYATAGSLSAGEYVCILAKNNDWAYVEYNTPSGRKRGYMSYSNLSTYHKPWSFADLFGYNDDIGISSGRFSATEIYSGPGSSYPVIGSLDNNETIYGYYDIEGTMYRYVEYYITGSSTRKSGYIYIHE